MSLECQVIGTSPFEVMWHKDLKEIKSSTKHSFSQVQDILNLEIQKCDGVDVGEYQCTVSNEVGSCSCRTTLRIKGLLLKTHTIVIYYVTSMMTTHSYFK